MCLQGDEEETQQKPVWLQEDGEEVGSPTAANAGQLHLEGPTPTQPMDPQGAADFIGLDDDTPGQIHIQSAAVTITVTLRISCNPSVSYACKYFCPLLTSLLHACMQSDALSFSHPFIAAYLSTRNVAAKP